jgi:hypothetical protein
MESGLKKAPMYNLNSISTKGDVEFFSKVMLQKKRKGDESIFFREAITLSSNIELEKYCSHWKDDSKDNNMEFLYHGE